MNQRDCLTETLMTRALQLLPPQTGTKVLVPFAPCFGLSSLLFPLQWPEPEPWVQALLTFDKMYIKSLHLCPKVCVQFKLGQGKVAGGKYPS